MNKITAKLVEAMKNELARSKYIDVSFGCEKLLCVSRERLNTALNHLTHEGYSVVTIKEKGFGKPTFRILCRKDDSAITDILKRRKILTKKNVEDQNEQK